jgi:hypothetical protein
MKRKSQRRFRKTRGGSHVEYNPMIQPKSITITEKENINYGYYYYYDKNELIKLSNKLDELIKLSNKLVDNENFTIIYRRENTKFIPIKFYGFVKNNKNTVLISYLDNPKKYYIILDGHNNTQFYKYEKNTI